MTKIELIKLGTSIIVGAGVAKIVTAVSLNNTSTEKITDKVTVNAGAYVLGAIAADVSKSYTDAKIDAVASWIDKNVSKKN